MSGILEHLRTLSAAEEFFAALGVAFEQGVVSVNRLHILKRFQQYLREDKVESLDETARKAACAACLERAYRDFQASSGVAEKVFKVFKDQQPAAPGFVSLDRLREGRT